VTESPTLPAAKTDSGGESVLGTGEREVDRDRDRIVNLSDGVFAIALTL
jgi:hypothetical protein